MSGTNDNAEGQESKTSKPKLTVLERITTSQAFRIYFLPIFVLWLLNVFFLWLLAPIEPESFKEHVFVSLGGLACLLCLWTLVVRYRMVRGKSPGKRALILLMILTVLMLLGLVFQVIEIIERTFQ